ncbi:glutamine-hydrolyzing GMP synthase [Leptolinea tardivitalis]|uniref:GMP synthase [glutamine-hydrolyzing] n=2 Tax=Leptolinea tardivitalis TaxID=229920 RepID=A0A0P6XHC7_9CHLR|nr:glutamine-hydrolyzing GMP synthase [Leptolinea tardivitalis]KPL70493.1 GMP synthase [Leptolinea tardivitalis]
MKPHLVRLMDTILILDFGSQYTQLIARRIRELHVYSEILPWDAPTTKMEALHPVGIILSGGPSSVYDEEAPSIQPYIMQAGVPLLGICYGMQAITRILGGQVIPAGEREFGPSQIHVKKENPLIPPGILDVWMSHGDRIDKIPAGFEILAENPSCPFAAMGNIAQRIYGVQFHPEVRHTPQGLEILRRFVLEICEAEATWTPESMIDLAVERIRSQVGDSRLLSAVSGGVDSSVATALAARAVGDRLSAVFVDHGLLRKNERRYVEKAFTPLMGDRFVCIDASEWFLQGLEGVSDPETKRKVIGETFIRVFENHARSLGKIDFLVQGTIYPDVVESSAPERNKAARIKTHHNVGGLPEDMNFKLVEPLRYFFKDEVRMVGEALGLPSELVWRQPFPGPGLAVRCLGEITAERLERLRNADAIFTEELTASGWLKRSATGEDDRAAQAFAVLLPVRSVGVMGDQRTYQEVVALRAVTTEDFMTADWARLPADLLGRVANRIVNEVSGVNRVVYDVTSKPPGTIEWE